MDENRQQNPASEASADQSEYGAGGGVHGLAHAIGTRNLLIIIVTMPLVFLVVVLATIAIFGKPGEGEDAPAIDASTSASAPVASYERLEEPAPAVNAARRAVSPRPASLDAFAADPSPIILPEGVRPTAISLDGDRVALHVEGPDGSAIVLYDAANGRVLQQIAIEHIGADAVADLATEFENAPSNDPRPEQ